MGALVVGLLICLAVWAVLRFVAGAGLRGPALGWAVDLAPPLIGFCLLVLATARPILSAIAIAGIGIGAGTVDRVKRAVLREPLVFADRAELLELVRHPQLYLPFAGTWRVLAGGAAILAVAIFAFWAEPPIWQISALAQIGLALLAPVLLVACFVVPTWPPLLRRLAAFYGRVGLTRDPATDIARVGLLASCVMHATLARAERPGRRRAAREVMLPALASPRVSRAAAQGGGPIVIVQSESFMDPTRLHPVLGKLLPELARLRQDCVSHGLLDVPCWGANTIRTELAILSGVADSILGLDRFNPYSSFIDPFIPSLVRGARDAGYTTICVHPFDLRFYERTRVLPMLGFDHLIGQEAFVGARRDGAYVADPDLAMKVAELVATHGPRTLVFAITMENHGPWAGMPSLAPPLPLPPQVAHVPDPAAFGRWLRHLRGADAMIPILTGCLDETADACGAPGWLMFYGDHQPACPHPSRASACGTKRPIS